MPLSRLLSLARLPRVSLAFLPTPIEPLSGLSRFLGGPSLFIKRDDQTGLATGGNKARKLEFLIAQALEAKADTVITAGATQSNHARQTAAAAVRYGLDCHLVLHGQPPPALTGNLLLTRLFDAVIHWTDERAPYTAAIAQVESELKAAGKYPYIIPYGGSNAYGLMGYVTALSEYAAQAKAFGDFDAHIFASSSGGTQAGLVLGAYLARLPEHTRFLGISVDRPAADLASEVAALATEGAKLLGINRQFAPSEIMVNDSYRGAGYAVVGEPEREAIRLLAQHEGILADPVYTGRALAALIDLIRQGAFTSGQRVLFWHTGGTAALFAFAHDLDS